MPDLAKVHAEELPFMVGETVYRDIYLGQATARKHIEDNIRKRYGTSPFDLPSAASCLNGDLPATAAVTDQQLAWQKLLSAAAIEVCLARVLNRFDSGDAAMAWLAAQGLVPNDSIEDPDLGLTYWFQWSPVLADGPLPWWSNLSAPEANWVVGLSVMIDICDRTPDCQQLADPKAAAPWFKATVQPISKYQK